MALFERKTKGARAASGAVRVPPTASRHDGDTKGREDGHRVASAAPAVAPVKHASDGASSPASYEIGSYSAVDARDAEAKIYAKRRRDQARHDAMVVAAIVGAGVGILLIVLFVTGVL